jgi:hypothetical protein
VALIVLVWLVLPFVPAVQHRGAPIVTFEEMEQALRERLAALPPAARAELIHVRAVLVGMLRETERSVTERK